VHRNLRPACVGERRRDFAGYGGQLGRIKKKTRLVCPESSKSKIPLPVPRSPGGPAFSDGSLEQAWRPSTKPVRPPKWSLGARGAGAARGAFQETMRRCLPFAATPAGRACSGREVGVHIPFARATSVELDHSSTAGRQLAPTASPAMSTERRSAEFERRSLGLSLPLKCFERARARGNQGARRPCGICRCTRLRRTAAKWNPTETSLHAFLPHNPVEGNHVTRGFGHKRLRHRILQIRMNHSR